MIIVLLLIFLAIAAPSVLWAIVAAPFFMAGPLGFIIKMFAWVIGIFAAIFLILLIWAAGLSIKARSWTPLAEAMRSMIGSTAGYLDEVKRRSQC